MTRMFPNTEIRAMTKYSPEIKYVSRVRADGIAEPLLVFEPWVPFIISATTDNLKFSFFFFSSVLLLFLKSRFVTKMLVENEPFINHIVKSCVLVYLFDSCQLLYKYSNLEVSGLNLLIVWRCNLVLDPAADIDNSRSLHNSARLTTGS